MTRLSKVNTLKVDLYNKIRTLQNNNNKKPMLEGYNYSIGEIEKKLRELNNNSTKEDFLRSKIKELNLLKYTHNSPNRNGTNNKNPIERMHMRKVREMRKKSEENRLKEFAKKTKKLKTELITLIGSIGTNNNKRKELKKYGHMYRISDIEKQLEELNNSAKEEFLRSKIKALKSFKNRSLETRKTRNHSRNGINPVNLRNNKSRSNRLKAFAKKTKRKRSHGRSKRLLKSTRNALKRYAGIRMKKIKVSKDEDTKKSREELKQNMIFIDYDEFDKEFRNNLDFFRHLNEINKLLSKKGYAVAMITSNDTLSVPEGTERSFFMSNSTSANNNSNNNKEIENIILVSTSDKIRDFKTKLLDKKLLLANSNPSMIIVNNHNGIKILKNLINDAESSYPPFTLDSRNDRMTMSRLQTLNNNNIPQFNNNIKGANFSVNLKLKMKGSKRTSIHSSLVNKGMSNNLRNTNDIVLMEVNDKVGITQDRFHEVHGGVNSSDYSVCIFLNLIQYENILGLDLKANRPVRPSRPKSRPILEEPIPGRRVYTYNQPPQFFTNPAFNPKL